MTLSMGLLIYVLVGIVFVETVLYVAHSSGLMTKENIDDIEKKKYSLRLVIFALYPALMLLFLFQYTVNRKL